MVGLTQPAHGVESTANTHEGTGFHAPILSLPPHEVFIKQRFRRETGREAKLHKPVIFAVRKIVASAGEVCNYSFK
jgi:hypothetical protein